MHLFGQDIFFNKSTEMPDVARDQEFSKIKSDIERSLKDQMRNSRADLRGAFRYR